MKDPSRPRAVAVTPMDHISLKMDEKKAVILYPVGGKYNVARQQQVFFECLLRDTCEAYAAVKAARKRDFIEQHVLGRLTESGRTLKLYRNPTMDDGGSVGCLVTPTHDEALRRLGQKLRDTRKQQLLKRAAASKAVATWANQPNLVSIPSSTKLAVKATTNGKPSPPCRSRTNTLRTIQSLPAHVPEKNDDYDDVWLDSWESDRNASLSAQDLKEILWGQWEEIDQCRRVCRDQKKQIEKLRTINFRQHEALMATPLSSPEQHSVPCDATNGTHGRPIQCFAV